MCCSRNCLRETELGLGGRGQDRHRRWELHVVLFLLLSLVVVVSKEEEEDDEEQQQLEVL